MKSFKRLNFFFLLVAGLFFLISILAACKSKPVLPPEEVPSAFLSFNGIEASDPENLILNFTLEIENSVPSAGRVTIQSWQIELNGKKANKGFSLANPDLVTFPLTAASSVPGERPMAQLIPLTLNMDVSALKAQELAPADEYKAKLTAELGFSFDSSPPVKLEVSGAGVFPGVRPPEFSITSIAILKAELINTRFRVGLKIDNPNPYPVELSAFGYELYGNGRLWADGVEKNVIKVPAKSSVTGNLFLIMNFINMKRDLLDQIIRLEDVNYRFAGEAQVTTGVEYLPKFKTGFELSGYSKVYDN